MSVYVDDMRAPFGRLIMCHMIADTSEELHEMAARIGVARKWVQYDGTHRMHYDICLSKRDDAVKLGAKEITKRELALIVRARNPRLGPVAAARSTGTDTPTEGDAHE